MKLEFDNSTNRIKKRYYITIVVLLIVITLASSIIITYQRYIFQYGERFEFILNQQQKDALDIFDCYSLQEQLQHCTLSFYRKEEKTINNNRIHGKADVYFTDQNYYQFDYMNISKGTYFTDFHMEYGRKVILIGDETALRFFLTNDVVGNSIYLNKEEYRIIGVYDESVFYLTFPAKPEKPRVFVPFTSSPVYPEETVDVILIADNEEYKTMNAIMDRVYVQEIKNKIMNYSAGSYINTEKLILQIFELVKFIIGILVLYAVSVVLFRIFKIIAAYFKKKLALQYYSEIVREREFSLYIPLICVISILIIYAVARLSAFNPYIPSEYLPPDNIFDLGYYINVIIESVVNERFSYGIDSDFKVIQNWTSLNIFFLSGAAFLCLILLRGYISILPASVIDRNLFIASIAAAIIGFVLGMLAAVILGLSASFFWKWYVLIVLFVLIFLLKRKLEIKAVVIFR